MAKTITTYSQGVEVVMPYTYVCACCGKTVTVRKSFPVIAQQSIQGYADTKRDDSIKESVSRKLPREVSATVQRETVRLESFRRSVASGAYGEYLRTGKLLQDAPSQEHSYTPPDTKRVICPACCLLLVSAMSAQKRARCFPITLARSMRSLMHPKRS